MPHIDEARKRAIEALTDLLRGRPPTSWRILLIEDVLARLRLIVWCPKAEWDSARDAVGQRLQAASAPFWTGEILQGSRKNDLPDGPWQADAWEAAVPEQEVDHLRVLSRHRAKTAWFEAPHEPPWRLRGDEPTVVVFYSFKGGVGRSTALAAAALQLAAAGDRVVVLDADLDAPGVGYLLAADADATPPCGVVDYLLERPTLDEAGSAPPELGDYYHRCAPELVPGAGEIIVFPAGEFGSRYLDKLARLDYGPSGNTAEHPFVTLLSHVRGDLAPRWILIDARAGLGDVAGFLTGGLCHFHVLLGTFSEPSWRGIELILDRLGGERVRQGRRQSDCAIAAAMVPRSQEKLFQEAVARFKDRAREAFSDHYYAEAEAGDEFWTVDDLESSDAPHVPVVLPYDERLALFSSLGDVADVLREGEPYRDLVVRLHAARERLMEATS